MKSLFYSKKSLRKLFLAMISIAGFILVISGSANAKDPLKPRLSYHWYPKHHSAISANKFVEECGKATNGKLNVKVFHSGQLYNIRQALSAVSSGSVELAGVLTLNFVPVDKTFMLGTLNHLWPDYKKQREFWTQTPLGKSKWDGIQKKLGIKVLCYIPVGPACIFSTKPMAGNVEELRGRKARYLMTSEKPGYKALGINVVSVSTGEVFTALKQGMIDTFLSVPSALKAYSWWDFAKYAYLPYWQYADAYIVANARWWNSLPQDIQHTVMTKVAPKISHESTSSIMAYSNAILDEFVKDKGGKVAVLPESEQKKMLQIYRTQAWPVLGKKMDANVYESAMKFMGY